MVKLLKSLFSDPSIALLFGEVDINIESSKEAIKIILDTFRLTKLSIKYSRPNADDVTKEADRLIKRFNRQNIRKVSTEYSSTDPEGIKADEETKALMDVALTNGYVNSQGYDVDGKKEIHSTKDHPVIIPLVYEPNIEIKRDSMIWKALDWLKINRKRR